MVRETYDLGLGGEYVHTNIYHFHRSLGSFADPRTRFDEVFQSTLDKQEQRERHIDEQFQNAGIKGGIDQFVERMAHFQTIVNRVWKVGEVTRAAYMPQDEQWDPTTLTRQSQILEEYLRKMTTFHENAMSIGGYRAKDVEQFMPGYTQLKQTLDNIIKKYETSSGTADKGIERTIAGLINRFKGLESKDLQVELSGMVARADGRQVKVDVYPHLDAWQTSFGISVKSTRQKTLEARWGATLHSGSVGSIANLIRDARIGPPILADQFKYFLINLSRMRDYAQAYGKEVAGPSKITDYPEYYKMVQQVAQTYATYFVGAELPGRTADVEIPELFNVDVFVLGDQIYKKSDLLRQIESGQMDVKFKLKEYLSQPQSYWDTYDHQKRKAMWDAGGAGYAEVARQDFVTAAAKKLLPQKAAITLHAIVKK